MLLTNESAQTALRTLRAANGRLDATQQRISTGLKVASAKDNAAFFLVSSTTNADIAKLQGARENLSYGLGAVRTAMTAQSQIDTAIQNIRAAVITLENGTAEQEISQVIEEQIEFVRDVIMDTNYNGMNLLEKRNLETFLGGVYRDSLGSLQFDNIDIRGAGLAIRGVGVDTDAPPFPGAVLDLNSSVDLGGPGLYTPRNIPNANGVNIGPGQAAFPQKTFAISFETGADINSRQIIYEQGGNVRGMNIYVENGQLVFGAYNLVTSDPSPAWPWREVRVDLEENTRYTAQLVLDGNTSNTGAMRAYLDGAFVDEVGGVGVLYEHPGGIGVGRINGNGVMNGTVENYSAATHFQGVIDKVVQYNQVFDGPDFDQVTTYLAEDWLPEKGIQYYVGSTVRQENATLVELLEAIIPVDQDGFSTAGALEVLDMAQKKSNKAFTEIGFAEARLVSQQTYLGDLIAGMEQGVAALVEADLAEESARLQAYQVQTQLAQQSLLISNQRPQGVLRLFA